MIARRRRMVKSGQLAAVFCLLLAAYGCAKQSFGDVPPGLLPEDFHVYTDGRGLAVNHPVPDFARVALHTINLYTGDDGCYLIVYSHDPRASAYPVGGGTYVVGQMRVRGQYEGRLCVPEGDEDVDIATDSKAKRLANRVFPGREGGSWPGGDTGGWFGVE